ncbi:MAG: LacI family DNA-binding transcriptional regulator [Anaerolineales bacterium]
MKDVAKRAGVSQATVSYVVNDTDGQNIPQETRERVRAAASELGYRPNVAARNMRTQRSNLIGFVTDTIATTPHAGAIIKGAQDVSRTHQKLLLLVNTEGDAAVETAAIETMLEHRVEGIVYATMYHRQVVVPENLRETRAVLLDCFSADRSIASVVPDEVGGGRRATEALLQKGHRRIGFLNNFEPVPATLGRLEGYRQALAAHGIEFDESLIRTGESLARGGYQCAQDLMQGPNRPSALFCYNDRMAMGAYDALRKLNLSVPEDVAVIGFDNQEIVAAALHPALSTMELPHYQMGEWAVRHLLEGTLEESQPVQKVLDCPFVARESI